MRIYLSGQMHGRTIEEVTRERDNATVMLKEHGFDVTDPAKSETSLFKDVFPTSMSYDLMESFVEKDLCLLEECDAVVWLTGDVPSYGSLYEVIRAKELLGMPIFIVAPRHYDFSVVDFMTVMEDGFIYPTTKEAVEALVAYKNEAHSR